MVLRTPDENVLIDRLQVLRLAMAEAELNERVQSLNDCNKSNRDRVRLSV